MKKIVVSVALIATNIVTLPNDAKAQKGFQIGIEGTPQMSWLMNKDDQKNKSFENVNTYNGSFGISSQLGLTNSAGIGLNVLYSFQGQKYKLNGIERNKNLEYLKIPLMFIYTNEINSKWSFVGKIGPQLDLLMKAKLTDKDGNNIVNDQKNAYANYDLAGVVSVGFALKLNDNFLLDGALRYDYGFTNAENKDYTNNINHPNGAYITNRAITNNTTAGLTIGLRYLFK